MCGAQWCARACMTLQWRGDITVVCWCSKMRAALPALLPLLLLPQTRPQAPTAAAALHLHLATAPAMPLHLLLAAAPAMALHLQLARSATTALHLPALLIPMSLTDRCGKTRAFAKQLHCTA